MDSYIHEKMQPIPLKKVTSFENSSELSLNNTFFDPSKMSPPNNFMDKLIKRMDTYYSPKKDNKPLLFQYSEKN
jgi:hypothetical protein